jgi:hypothetical protein
MVGIPLDKKPETVLLNNLIPFQGIFGKIKAVRRGSATT